MTGCESEQRRLAQTPGSRGGGGRLAVVGVLALTCALGVGCSGPAGAGRELGVDLGTFAIEAALVSNDCGPSAFDSPERFSYEVDLASTETQLFWAGVGGSLDAELEFEIVTGSRVPLREARGELAGCAVERTDRVGGVLQRDGSGEVTAASGELSFAFSQSAEAACTPEDLTEAGLTELPCELRYALEGQRTRPPRPEGAE